jgi:HAE1 family hydrophobic/amphiphilic exporter-1
MNAVELVSNWLKQLQLENDYKSNEVKLQIAKRQYVFTLEAADSVLHDLLIAVILH